MFSNYNDFAREERNDYQLNYKTKIDQNKITELFSLINELNTQKISTFITKYNVPLYVTDNDGNTLIHKVIEHDTQLKNEHNKLNMIRWLINNGCNPDMPNSENITPLHLACQYQYSHIISHLVEKGSDINYQDDFGNTPFHYLLNGTIEIYKSKITGNLVKPQKLSIDFNDYKWYFKGDNDDKSIFHNSLTAAITASTPALAPNPLIDAPTLIPNPIDVKYRKDKYNELFYLLSVNFMIENSDNLFDKIDDVVSNININGEKINDKLNTILVNYRQTIKNKIIDGTNIEDKKQYYDYMYDLFKDLPNDYVIQDAGGGDIDVQVEDLNKYNILIWFYRFLIIAEKIKTHIGLETTPPPSVTPNNDYNVFKHNYVKNMILLIIYKIVNEGGADNLYDFLYKSDGTGWLNGLWNDGTLNNFVNNFDTDINNYNYDDIISNARNKNNKLINLYYSDKSQIGGSENNINFIKNDYIEPLNALNKYQLKREMNVIIKNIQDDNFKSVNRETLIKKFIEYLCDTTINNYIEDKLFILFNDDDFINNHDGTDFDITEGPKYEHKLLGGAINEQKYYDLGNSPIEYSINYIKDYLIYPADYSNTELLSSYYKLKINDDALKKSNELNKYIANKQNQIAIFNALKTYNYKIVKDDNIWDKEVFEDYKDLLNPITFMENEIDHHKNQLYNDTNINLYHFTNPQYLELQIMIENNQGYVNNVLGMLKYSFSYCAYLMFNYLKSKDLKNIYEVDNFMTDDFKMEENEILGKYLDTGDNYKNQSIKLFEEKEKNIFNDLKLEKYLIDNEEHIKSYGENYINCIESYFKLPHYCLFNPILSQAKEILLHLIDKVFITSIVFIINNLNNNTVGFGDLNIVKKISEKLLLNNIKIFDDKISEIEHNEQSINEILTELFKELKDEAIINDTVFELLRTDILKYFELVIPKTIMNWMVIMENCIKFLINHYRMELCKIYLKND